MLNTIVWDWNPVFFHIGGLGIRYYSLCWIIGFALGYLVVKNLYRKEGIATGNLDNLLFYVLLGAMIGARLGHCLFYDWKYFSHHLLEIFLPISISAGGIKFTGYAGLASHGGVIGIIIALFLFRRKYKCPLLPIFDKMSVAAPLGGAMIRMGNLFNSEIIGIPSKSAFAFIFKRIDNIPRHPAQVYEAIAYLLIFVVLLLSYKKLCTRKEGTIFGLAMVLIFLSRFFIEYYKEVNDFQMRLRSTIGLDTGQLLSIPFILMGIYFFARGFRRQSDKNL